MLKSKFTRTAAGLLSLTLLAGQTFLSGCASTASDASVHLAPGSSAVSAVSVETGDSLQAVAADSLTASPVSGITFSPDQADTYVQDLLQQDLTKSKAVLDVPELLQNPELPTGCETTALTIVLDSFGLNAEKTDIASNYLPYDANCAIGFAGDPFSENGAGIYPPGLSIAAERYTRKYDPDLTAVNTTGTSMTDLYKLVAAGYPVLIWSTMFMGYPSLTDTSYTAGEYTYYWYSNEHCVVLYGYDQDKDEVYISDPLVGLVTRSASAFTEIFDTIGQYSMVLVDGKGVAENDANIPSASTTVTDEDAMQQQYTQIQEGRNQTQTQTYTQYNQEQAAAPAETEETPSDTPAPTDQPADPATPAPTATPAQPDTPVTPDQPADSTPAPTVPANDPGTDPAAPSADPSGAAADTAG